MDPLQELFDLYENEMLQDPNPTVAEPAPAQSPAEHPVAVKKKMLDDEIQAGSDPISAYEKVFGDVDTFDPQSKAEVAKVLNRYNKSRHGNVAPEPGSTSIFALDAALEQMEDEAETEEDEQEEMKTPSQFEEDPRDKLDKMEEYDYNLDVAYLQKFGRA